MEDAAAPAFEGFGPYAGHHVLFHRAARAQQAGGEVELGGEKVDDAAHFVDGAFSVANGVAEDRGGRFDFFGLDRLLEQVEKLFALR